MNYNPIAQADDNDAASQSSDSDIADHHSVQAIPGESAHESIASAAQLGLGNLVNSINNNHSPEYEIIEEDDYEEIVDSTKEETDSAAKNANRKLVQPTSTVADWSKTGAEIVQPSPSPDEPLVRTSSDISVPLRHPTPDLQSLQGAYVGNIERLEKSAERLSMTSSDLGVELRKLDLEQKRRSSVSSIHQGLESPSRHMSTSSLSNSIIAVNSAARSGGYSPGGFLTSPRGSILSGSRYRSTSVTSPLQEIHEPGQEEDMENNEISTFDDRDVPILTPRPLPALPRNSSTELLENHVADELVPEAPDRPLTAHSTDTYQRATDLFLDFDGVHFVPHPRESNNARQLTVNRQPMATTAERHQEPQVGKDMVYYPAPIPKFLNLPQRLSKQTAKSQNEKRRTQLMDIISPPKKEAKGEEIHELRTPKRLSTLPPQLRASVFFDQPSGNLASLEVQLKDRSAVSTLDSILDASTHAPVSAFTDHPIVGSAGGKVYGGTDKKRSSRLPSGKGSRDALRMGPGPRASALFVPGEGLQDYSDAEAAERDRIYADDSESDDGHSHSHSSSDGSSSGSHDSDNDATGEEDDEEEEEVGEEDVMENEEQMLFGRPTTLLAELEMRKQEQKLRNRSAAKAFPNGMHSTLLQLDAVAQAQSNKRRQKHVTLAWETEATEDPDDADDEDIPLGVLYGGKTPVAEERPLGLMERRELEENEPLSKRRARLRGEVIPPSMPNKRVSTMTQLQNLVDVESDSGEEGETLAQRLRRLKQEKVDKSKSIISAEFEREIMNELGKLHEPDEPVAKTPDEPVQKQQPAEEEETLGQRRKRLQAEAAAQAQQGNVTKNVRASRSMADILQAYPSSNGGYPRHARQMSQMSLHQASPHTNTHRPSTGFTVPPSMTFHAGFTQTPGYPTISSYETQPVYGYGNMPYNTFIPGVPPGMNPYAAGMAYPHNAAMIPQNIDNQQRDVIDRWRQSIVR